MSAIIIILILLCFACLYRAWQGPTIPDRMVAIDTLGIIVVAIAALLALPAGREFFIDIALGWIFLSFIGTIALAKYLYGRKFDE